MRTLAPALLAVSLLLPAAARAADDAAPAPAKAAAVATFTPAPSGWYVELRSGTATQTLDDPDANIGFIERFSEDNLGAPGPLRRFGNATAFAGEIGRRRGAWSWGIEVEHQRQRVKTFAAGTLTGSFDCVSLMAVTDVRLAATIRPRNLYGFEVGASAGTAYGHYSEHFAIAIYQAPQFDTALSGVYHATSLSGGAHLGWRRPLYGNSWLVARAAWSWRKFDKLAGTQTNEFGSGTTNQDLVRLTDGKTASIDATGFQFTAGLSHTFGGRR